MRKNVASLIMRTTDPEGLMRQETTSNGAEPGLSDLFRRLGDHASSLVRGEVALAKLELRDTVSGLVRSSGKLGVAVALAFLGGLALTTAAIIGVGHLLGGRFGLAALLLGVLLLGIGALLARSGMNTLNGGELRPDATLASLDRTGTWAKKEIKSLKEGLTTPDDDGAMQPAPPPHRERTFQP